MTIEERRAFVNRVYGLACAKGLCSTKTEFARLLDVNPSNLSAALRTRPEYLTDLLIGKVQAFASANGLDSLEEGQTP